MRATHSEPVHFGGSGPATSNLVTGNHLAGLAIRRPNPAIRRCDPATRPHQRPDGPARAERRLGPVAGPGPEPNRIDWAVDRAPKVSFT